MNLKEPVSAGNGKLEYGVYALAACSSSYDLAIEPMWMLISNSFYAYH